MTIEEGDVNAVMRWLHDIHVISEVTNPSMWAKV